MVYDCGACLAKYVLCLFNFIFFFCGTLILGVGVWLAVDKNSFIGLIKIVPTEHLKDFTRPTVIEQTSYILIAAGAFMFIVSFLGYCGALRESRCLLTTYGICLIIILGLEITAAGLAFGYKDKAEQETKTYLKESIKKYYSNDNRTAFTVVWDHLQSQLSCCGVENYQDYEWSGSKKIPESCCVLGEDKTLFKPLSPECTTSPNDANSFYNKGCFQELIKFVMLHMNILIGVAIGLGILQLLGLFLACCLSKTIDGYIK